MKANPLAWWEFQDCMEYLERNGLERHPLHDQACAPRCSPCYLIECTFTPHPAIYIFWVVSTLINPPHACNTPHDEFRSQLEQCSPAA